MNRKIIIEIKSDFNDPQKDRILIHLAKEAARNLITAARLIQDQRTPEIAMSSSDFFNGEEEIMINEETELHPPQEPVAPEEDPIVVP